MVVHRLSTFKNVDGISLIQDDKIIDQGAPATVRKQERRLQHARQLAAETAEYMRSLSSVLFSAILGLRFMDCIVLMLLECRLNLTRNNRTLFLGAVLIPPED
jgi:hypothetical protein